MLYLCSMKDVFGRWLLDISKYIATVVILSSVFGDLEKWVVYVLGVFAVVITLVLGLSLVDKKKGEE